MDLRDSLRQVEEHNHSKQPHLFQDAEELGERLEAITSKDDAGARVDFYLFKCLFANLKIHGRLYSFCTIKDLDGRKKLAVFSDRDPPAIEATRTIEEFPLRWQDLKKKNIRPGDNETAQLIIVPASHKESKLFSFLPEGIGEKETDGPGEDRDLYLTTKEFISARWGVLKDGFVDIVACYDLVSWLRELFPAAPVLAATGKVGTGKSLLMMILETLGFLAVDLASITGPAIGYVDEFYHPFLVHDECQTLNNFRSPDVAEKVAIINSRYKHRSKRVKMSEATATEPRTVEVQRLYGFTALAGTEMPQALGIQDRSIQLPSVYANPKRLIDDLDSEREAAIIRCRALAFRARHLFDDFAPFRKQFDELLTGCTGRVREQAYAILYIAKVCAPEDILEKLVKFFKSLDESKRRESAVGELADILSAYATVLKGGSEDVLLADCLGEINNGKAEKDQISASRLGLKLKTLGFTTYRESTSDRRTRIKYDGELLKRQAESFNIDFQSNFHTKTEEEKRDTSPIALAINKLRSVNPPLSWDYAVELVQKTFPDRQNAEQVLTRLKDDGLFIQDPDGYWRLTK